MAPENGLTTWFAAENKELELESFLLGFTTWLVISSVHSI